MIKNFNFSKEEKLLIKILFFLNSISKHCFINIDFDKFVKITSSYQLLPTVYSQLKKQGLLPLIPHELSSYLSEIYKLNNERNLYLIKELDIIEKVLRGNGITYLKLKGAYYTKNKYFSSVGERMIGDIDILIDPNQIISCLNIFFKKNYYILKPITKYWKKRHIPKLINKEKLFSIELHDKLLRPKKNRFLTTSYYFKNFKLNKEESIIKYLILNDQINDYNYLNARINFKTLYDFYCIKKNKINLNYFNNKYFKQFFLITNKIGITDLDFKFSMNDKLFILRYNLKRKYALYFKLDRFICKIIEVLPIRLIQLIELLFNKEYRKYVKNRF